MASKSCIVVTKYFLFIFNLFFFFLGGVLLGFGLWILFDKTSFIAVLETASVPLHLWSYLFSGLGIFTMMMGFLGCIGALKEVKCMLGIYFTFLVFLMASQITIGVLVYTQRRMIEKKLSIAVKDLIEKYNRDDEHFQNLEDSWDYIQLKFSCCGWNSSLEWLKNPIIGKNASTSSPNTNQLFPCSCYSSFSKNFTHLNITEEVGFCLTPGNPLTERIQGCRKKVFEWVQENIISITITCIGITVVELLLLALSFNLLLDQYPLSTANRLLQHSGASSGPSSLAGDVQPQAEPPAKPSIATVQTEQRGEQSGLSAKPPIITVETGQKEQGSGSLSTPPTITMQTVQKGQESGPSANLSATIL